MPKHTLLFSDGHQSKLYVMLETAGDNAAHISINKLKHLVMKYAKVFEKSDFLAVERCSALRRIAQYSDQLEYWLSDLDIEVQRYLFPSLALTTLTAGDSAHPTPAQKSRLERKLLTALPRLSGATVAPYEQFHTVAWLSHGENDSAFRTFCIQAAAIWQRATGIPFPKVAFSDVNHFYGDDNRVPDHPLWLLVHTLGIDLDGATMAEIVKWTIGKDVPPSECHQPFHTYITP